RLEKYYLCEDLLMERQRKITYSDDERQAAADLIQDALNKHGWNPTQAAGICGVDADTVLALRRTLPTGMGFGYVAAVLLGLDVDIYEFCHAAGLDSQREANMRDPKLREHYCNPHIKALLKEVEPERREEAEKMIYFIISPQKIKP